MKEILEIATGTVQGTDHVRAAKNNQDALNVRQTDDYTIAVVCDGCSSGKHSEAGANFGALLIATEIERAVKHRETMKKYAVVFGSEKEQRPLSWSLIQRNLVETLHRWSEAMGVVNPEGRVASAFVNDYLLFTCVAAIITAEEAEFVAFGDGFVIVNGEVFQIGPFENNTPPYLAYGLAKTSLSPESLAFKVIKKLPTAELEHFLIGSDGISSLVEAETKPFPGKANLVGPVSQVWTDDRFFKNPDVGRRHLTLVNGGIGSRLPGHLEDDTTFVAGRRKQAGQ